QRAEAAALVALRPADDHELLALDAFDLEPVASAGARMIGRAGLLRDDALAAHFADFAVQLLAAPDNMVAEEDRRMHALQQRGETVLALDVGQLLDVLAAIDQQVEGIESEVGASAVLQRRLEQLEARPALIVECDRLPVDEAAGGK